MIPAAILTVLRVCSHLGGWTWARLGRAALGSRQGGAAPRCSLLYIGPPAHPGGPCPERS